MKQRTRIKICGITRPADAEACQSFGADAIGLVLVKRSPRCVTLSEAAEISRHVRGLTVIIALVMDLSAQDVQRTIDELRPDMLQFHGRETPEFCDQFGVPYLKALSYQVEARTYADYRSARGFVVDSHAPGAPGGSGQRFDWDRYPRVAAPVLLAGGLNPTNVADAVARVRPYGVDVSSGVEASPGVKDYSKLEQFFAEVARADYGN